MTTGTAQFGRKAELVVVNSTDLGPDLGVKLDPVDLSEMRFRFQVSAADTQSPNSAAIRVYNLKDETAKRIKGEFARVTLKAGYDGAFGVIFQGSVKQFRFGRESAKDTFLDILASDGDLGYNFGLVGGPSGKGQVFAAGTKLIDQLKAAANDMGIAFDPAYIPAVTGLENPNLYRSKVGFGLWRSMLRDIADTLGATWSIQNGKLQMISKTGYLPGETVVINWRTGMVGIPEQTDMGIRVRTLLNSRVRIGGLVQLNNKDITTLAQANPNDPLKFNQRVGIQLNSKIADGADGLYRAYVAEHTGDTRGQEWYTDLTCLAVQSNQAPLQ
jgi:hypothetical protein